MSIFGYKISVLVADINTCMFLATLFNSLQYINSLWVLLVVSVYVHEFVIWV